MSDAKHTPGEWAWLKGHARLVSDGGAGVLSPWWDFETEADGIAVSPEDARLIAAAPEMLEALRAEQAWVDHRTHMRVDGEDGIDAWWRDESHLRQKADRLRAAALAKVEGKTDE